MVNKIIDRKKGDKNENQGVSNRSITPERRYC